MSKQGMVQACTLQVRDTIEVPVEACRILSMRKVPGQLKNRRNHLIEVKVVPLTGPWSNLEGSIIIESSDLIPLISREKSRTRRCRAIKNALNTLKEKIFGVRVESMPSLPPPVRQHQFSQTGPMT